MNSGGEDVEAVSDFVDDEPVSMTFKAQAVQRAKSEKAANSFIQITKQKAKAKRRARQMVEGLGQHSTHVCSMEETADLQKAKETPGECDFTEIETDNPLPKLASGKPKTRRRRNTKTADNEDEFGLADTFDFRKYLPQSLLNKDADTNYLDENDADLDFEEEELGKAILEGGFGRGLEERCHDSDEQDKERISTKKRNVGSPEAPGAKNLDCDRKRRRRGKRRYHKQYSAAPRIIIFSRQDTANAIRRRADGFVNQRLFGTETGVGKVSRGPNRMTPQDMSKMAAKLKARRLARRGF
ncbi:unnamed protein product [Taenia asiatica]|uniref:NUC153 domain-containing protein n=1 Tax=Taenia asiatica TaxID=60517 RepID=A0A0R3W270_TAEAS|nr:unnamed protein product [Taenia asiatica]